MAVAALGRAEAPGLLRSPGVWIAAVWFAILIHLDWHLARPADTHLGFGLRYHWILGILAAVSFAVVWSPRWPERIWRRAAVVLCLGALIGQGLETLAEGVVFRAGWEPFRDAARWRGFAEFMAMAVFSFVACAVVLSARRRAAPS